MKKQYVLLIPLVLGACGTAIIKPCTDREDPKACHAVYESITPKEALAMQITKASVLGMDEVGLSSESYCKATAFAPKCIFSCSRSHSDYQECVRLCSNMAISEGNYEATMARIREREDRVLERE